MKTNTIFLLVSTLLPMIFAAPTAVPPPTLSQRDLDGAVLSKRCFSNGGGWYWCALDEEQPSTDDSASVTKRDGLDKRCFSNGGGWYWCALDEEQPSGGETSDVSKRDLDNGVLSKRCFSNGGGWYWCALDEEQPSANGLDNTKM